MKLKRNSSRVLDSTFAWNRKKVSVFLLLFASNTLRRLFVNNGWLCGSTFVIFCPLFISTADHKCRCEVSMYTLTRSKMYFPLIPRCLLLLIVLSAGICPFLDRGAFWGGRWKSFVDSIDKLRPIRMLCTHLMYFFCSSLHKFIENVIIVRQMALCLLIFTGAESPSFILLVKSGQPNSDGNFSVKNEFENILNHNHAVCGGPPNKSNPFYWTREFYSDLDLETAIDL